MSESTTAPSLRAPLSNHSNENIHSMPTSLLSNENLPPVNGGGQGRPRAISGTLSSRLTEQFPHEKHPPPHRSADLISEGSEDNTDAAAQLDKLLAELEDEDGKEEDVTAEKEVEEGVGAPKFVGEELLQTNRRTGLQERDVLARRKTFGLNELNEHRERRWKQFAMFFVGPIQFVMEVCWRSYLEVTH